MKQYKKIRVALTMLAALACVVAAGSTALAVNTDRSYEFALTADKIALNAGDTLTVTVTLTRTDSSDNYAMYSVQDMISYDGDYLELVSVDTGVSGYDCTLREDGVLISSYSSLAAGTTTPNSLVLATLTFTVKDKSGTTAITNTMYEMGTTTGMDSYQSTARDMSVTVTGTAPASGSPGTDDPSAPVDDDMDEAEKETWRRAEEVLQQTEAGQTDVAARLNSALILRIDKYMALSKGELTRIDEQNKLVKPYIDSNSRTLVPVRFIAEALGAQVDWDDISRQVTVTLADKTVVLGIGKTGYTLNGEAKTMDTAPVINTGWNRTMVPARFVAEALGMDVYWDNANRLVIITPAETPWNENGETERAAIELATALMTN